MDRARDANTEITAGFKLDIDFASQQSYRELFGGRDIPRCLAEMGFASVETPVGPETDRDALIDYVKRCGDGGLKVSLHPYSESTGSNPAFFSAESDNTSRSFHERFLSLAAEVRDLQEAPTVVNIHSAATSSDYDRRTLVDRSVSFFSWAHQWCRENAPEVRVVAELQISPNPGEPIVRIGDTYEELLEVATRSGVRACWDFGHAYMNHLRYGVPLYPPEDFLAQLGHVHCHDVRGDDHHPLVYDTVPWKEFIRLLIESGYCGAVILEIFPWNLIVAGGIRSLAESLSAVKARIELCIRNT